MEYAEDVFLTLYSRHWQRIYVYPHFKTGAGGLFLITYCPAAEQYIFSYLTLLNSISLAFK